jgi:hypothetical protein
MDMASSNEALWKKADGTYRRLPHFQPWLEVTELRGLSPQANYTDRATAAVDEVVPTCH